MIQIHESLITDLLSNPALKKSDARTILFLLQKPGALSADELSKGIGVSKRAAIKSVNRLIGAGVIQPGEYQAKRRTLNISSLEQMEPKAVTEGSNRESFDTFKERFDRLESMIGSIMDTLGAGLNPSPSLDGEIVTVTVPIQAAASQDSIPDGNGQGVNETSTLPIPAIEEPSGNIQTIMILENIPNETKALSVISEQAIKGTVNDSIVSDLDGAIKYAGARLAAVKAASLLKEKANSSFSDTCAPANIGAEFKALFGVQLPSGSDQAAAAVMIGRKKSGKLDNVKSPLAYLASIAGKVTPTLATPAELKTPPVINIQPVTEPPRLSHADMSRLNDMWDAMTGEQRIPFEETALPKFESQTGKHKVPLHLLAKGVFNAQYMSHRG
jgi:hypothetical protein